MKKQYKPVIKFKTCRAYYDKIVSAEVYVGVVNHISSPIIRTVNIDETLDNFAVQDKSFLQNFAKSIGR